MDARELWRTRDVTGLSVGFVPIPERTKPIEHPDGSVTLVRREAILDHVGLVARPAYPDAQVVSMRSDEEPEPLTEVLKPHLDQWKEELGIE